MEHSKAKVASVFLFYKIKKDILKERNFEDSLSFVSYSIDFQLVPSSIMRKFIYKSGRTPSAQGREPALNCPIAEGRERVKGGEAACEALDVSSVFCY